MSPADAALVLVGRGLRDAGYRFASVTPVTHQHYMSRHRTRLATGLRDIFGWNLPFEAGTLPAPWQSALASAGVLRAVPQGFVSRVRFSTLGDMTFLHGGFPTDAQDAVFFGPDTQRFVSFIRAMAAPCETAIDVGCGSGAGGLCLGGIARRMVLADISGEALRFAAINRAINHRLPQGAEELPGLGGWMLLQGGAEAAHHGLQAPWHNLIAESNLYNQVPGNFDLIVANPPYMVDDAQRLYRHGGDNMGIDLAVRIVAEGIERLNPGGQILLYTGSPVVDGVCCVHGALKAHVGGAGGAYQLNYQEIDPDVFSEELLRPCYARAERIAAVGVQITRAR